jgi:hypothetical protein
MLLEDILLAMAIAALGLPVVLWCVLKVGHL